MKDRLTFILISLLLAVFLAGCASSSTATDAELAAAAAEEEQFRTLQNSGAFEARKGNFREALDYFVKAEKIRPDDVELLGQIGTTLRYLKKYEKALTYFERIHELNPNDHQALINIGVIQRSQGNYPEAVEAFKKTLEIEPDQKLTLVNLADLYFMIDAFDQSRQYIQQFKEVVEAENPDELTRLERNWNSKAKQKIFELEATIEKKLAEDPNAGRKKLTPVVPPPKELIRRR